jgi:hypothetical protein
MHGEQKVKFKKKSIWTSYTVSINNKNTRKSLRVCSMQFLKRSKEQEIRLLKLNINTGHTQSNGAVYMVYSIDTAPFFCVCPVQSGAHVT